MMWMLTTYWLEALLAVSGAMTVIGLLVNQIGLRKKYDYMLVDFVKKCARDASRNLVYGCALDALKKDFTDLKSRLDLLDKPSNDRALSNIATILSKKAQKYKGGKSFQRNKIATSKPRRKANGVGIHAR